MLLLLLLIFLTHSIFTVSVDKNLDYPIKSIEDARLVYKVRFGGFICYTRKKNLFYVRCPFRMWVIMITHNFLSFVPLSNHCHFPMLLRSCFSYLFTQVRQVGYSMFPSAPCGFTMSCEF